MYEKEKEGRKPNTLRRIYPQDDRFKLLRNGCKIISIYNTNNLLEHFERKITDYTEWEGWAIISWKHSQN